MKPVKTSKISTYYTWKKVMLNSAHLKPSDYDLLCGLHQVGDCKVVQLSSTMISLIPGKGKADTPFWCAAAEIGISDELVKLVTDLSGYSTSFDEVEFGDTHPTLAFYPTYESEWSDHHEN